MQFVIITGMSGSGKSTAMRVMEDIGFYCIDNLPPQLIPKIVDLCDQTNGTLDRVAIVVDIRTGGLFSEIYQELHELRNESGVEVKVLFTEASDDVLIKRYKETRRKHPFSDKFSSLREAIRQERHMLRSLRDKADYYFETSQMSTAQLGEEIRDVFLEHSSDSLLVKITSFGYKYGISRESDLVFDVRCLPNPYYVPELKAHTGCESCVQEYVMDSEKSQTLMHKIKDLLDFLLPLYVAEGKSQIVISFGCTGGKHRSVTFAELIGDMLGKEGYQVHKMHRDITKDKP
ncbi:MAG: RNase adapter RapZ [Oscillospiraceae bacterium]|nr:RNase adapter RapZ [Oscillospiraceae bacterium]